MKVSSRLVPLLVVLSLATALLVGVGPARAQRTPAHGGARAPAHTTPTPTDADANVARARALFAEGVGFVQAERFGEAEASFRGALALRDAPTIRYNLAFVLFKRGAYPEAMASTDAVLRDPTSTPALKAQAESVRRQIAERAGYAQLELRGTTDAVVAVDGYGVTDLAAEVALAPGAHIATASQAGRELARASVEVATGQHARLLLEVAPLVLAVAAVPDAPSESADAPLLKQWWFWTAVGGGVVILAVIVGAVISASSGVENPIEGNFQPGVLRW